MSSVRNRDSGHEIEEAAADRWPLERVPELDHHDLEATESTEVLDEGDVVEAKACVDEIVNGSTRAGRWWIARRNHDHVLEAGGSYVLGVYSGEPPGVEIESMALLDARTVDELLADRWVDCGDRHAREASAQLPWTAVFDDLEGGSA